MTNPADAPSEASPPALAEALRVCRGAFVAVVLFSLTINVLLLAAPLYMLQVYDRVLVSRSIDTLILLTAITGAALLTLAGLDAVRGFVMVRISTWIDTCASGVVLAGTIAATLRAGGDRSVQGLRDLSTVRTFITGPAMFPFLDAPWTPIFVVIIFLLHPVLGAIALGGAVFLFALAVSNELATRALLFRSGAASMRALREAEAAVRNADVLEAMGMTPNLLARWHRRNAETLALQERASMRGGTITATSKFVRLSLQVGMLGTGAWLTVLGETTPGIMIAAAILMSRALAPVEQAIGAWRQALAARNAFQRVKPWLKETLSRRPAMPLPAPTGRLRVEGLAFVHPGATEPVLQGLNFGVEPGEMIGLIGPTAAGKTTLARLIIGNLVPRAGHVRLDNMDVAQWDSEDLGRHIGYLPQDVELFSGTVRENIARMGEGEPDTIVAAARLAGAHEMILGLPQGYDTEIGDGGAALSGGQRQRIALCRALYGEPRFVVLDEPNANLDSDGEEALVNAMAALKERGTTLVVIAHRASILRHVDKVLILRGGTIEVFGPRDQVIPKVAATHAVERASPGARPRAG